jgi:hypothetical protein
VSGLEDERGGRGVLQRRPVYDVGGRVHFVAQELLHQVDDDRIGVNDNTPTRRFVEKISLLARYAIHRT